MFKRVVHSFHLIIIFYLLLVTTYTLAQDNESRSHSPKMQFKHAFDVGGEPTRSIIQDRDGFIWVGSFFNGAVRFDGSETKTYLEGPNSLSNSFATQIFEDSEGYIWIGTNDGLNRYDKSTDSFKVYRHDSDDPNSLPNNVFNMSASTIVEDQEGYLWFGTQGGLSRFEKKTETFTNYLHDPQNPHTLSSNDIFSVNEDRDGFLWIATKTRGVNKLDTKTGRVTRYGYDSSSPVKSLPDDVLCAVEGPQGYIWLGTVSQGLFKFDKHNETFTQYKYSPVGISPLPKVTIWNVRFLKSGKLVLTEGSDNAGLVIFDPANEASEVYKHDPGNRYSLLGNSTHGGFEDHNGILWVVLNSGEVQTYDPKSLQFRLYRHNPLGPGSLASNAAIPIFEDSKGTIWIGHFGSGLDRYNPDTDSFTNFKHDPKDKGSILHNYPSGFFEDGKGNFYVSTARGMSLFDRKTGRVAKHLTRDTWFYSIKQDPINPDLLWANGWQQGWCNYHKKTGQVYCHKHDPGNSESLSNDTSLKFIIDKDAPHLFWLATWGGGLERFDSRTATFTHYRANPDDPGSIGSDTIYEVYEDSRGKFWVGTADGLHKFNKKEGTFRHYSKADGFTPRVIHYILEDDDGYLWMGTDAGLVKFNSDTETIIKIYTSEDGLHSHDFFNSSSLKTQDGRIWVGGFKGLNVFHPSELKANDFIPNIYLTSIKQDGKELQTGVAPEELKEIVLDWRQSSFEFEYAGLSYTNPSKNQYAYMLEGLEEDWLQTGNKQFGRYSSIPPGEYNLRVKGSNNDGLWNEEGLSIKVTVTPPVWQTWWFRLPLGLAIIVLLLTLYRWRIYTLKQRSLALEIQVKERTNELQAEKNQAEFFRQKAEVASQAKSVFLTSMSHELRTPLNAILGYSQLMARDTSIHSNTRAHIGTILHSGEHLLGMIDSVLDLEKIEAGKAELNEQVISLPNELNSLIEMLRPRAAEKQLSLQLLVENDLPQYVQMDSSKLAQILINLLGNAVKYTDEGGIVCRAEFTQNKGSTGLLKIEVEDTGRGISKESLGDIFQPFAQAGNRQGVKSSTGLGLTISKGLAEMIQGSLSVRSSLGEGSVFSLKLPVKIVNKADSQEQQHPVVTKLAPGQPDWHILIAEDEPNNRRLLSTFLKNVGFCVNAVTNGQECIDYVKDYAPDFLWMDMQMPIMDGMEATRLIRSLPGGEAVSIVGLTASAFQENHDEIIAAGCNQVLRKPYRFADILMTMEALLGAEYLYHGEEHIGDEKMTHFEIQAVNLTELPTEWLKACSRAARQGHEPLLTELISQLDPEYKPQAQLVAHMTKNLQFSQLVDLIEGKADPVN